MDEREIEQPLKVALISDFCLPRLGGIELQLRDLGAELGRRGHTVQLITSTPGEPELSGMRVHRLRLWRRSGLGVSHDPRLLRKVAAILERERFDVLHCHSALSPLATGAAYLGRRLGIPSVLTEHSVLRQGRVHFFRALRGLYRWPRWPQVLSAVSSVVAEDLRRISGRSDVLVLPNGLHVAEWRDEHSQKTKESGLGSPKKESGKKPLRVTSVMRFTARKRPLAVISALSRVLSRCPEDERPIFTLVGDGPERPKVQKEAQRLGVLPYLELPGLLPRSEVRRILHESDLFILPTVKEALSIATIEARSAGLPVVAMAQSGVRDVVAHQQNGLLARTQEEFEDAVISLLQNHELRNRLASAAQNGLERFSWDSVIREHLFAYHLAMGIAARRK